MNAVNAEMLKALQEALPWFEEADVPGADEMAERIRALIEPPNPHAVHYPINGGCSCGDARCPNVAEGGGA